jgi:CRP-like cAMP-binding protein
LALLLVQVRHRQPPGCNSSGICRSLKPGETVPIGAADASPVPLQPAELASSAHRRESDVFEVSLTKSPSRAVRPPAVNAGERLARGGSRGESLFVILTGELSLLTHDASEKPVRTAHPRETVPLAAIIEPPVLVTTVEAQTDAEVFVIPRIRLLDLFDGQPMIALQVYKAAAKSFDTLSDDSDHPGDLEDHPVAG